MKFIVKISINKNQNQMKKTVETQTECWNWWRKWYWICKNNSITPKRTIKAEGEETKILILILFFQMAKVEYITNYEVMYDTNEKDEKICKLVEERETDYYIFKRICELAKNSYVTNERWSDVKIDINVKRNNWLLYDLSSKLTIKFIRILNIVLLGFSFLWSKKGSF